MPAADLPLGEPIWLFHGSHQKPMPLASAAQLLERLDQRDFSLLLLTYGLGMRVGAISRAMHLDPALVVWRLNDIFRRWQEEHGTEGGATALERALRDLLHGDGEAPPPAPPKGCTGWRTDELLQLFDEQVRERLFATLNPPAPVVDKRAPGLGIGLAILIGLGSLVFLGYGVVRDISVMMRGHALMRSGKYAEARSEFRKEGTSEATQWIIVSLLAEGEFDEAFRLLSDPESSARFGAFAPSQRPITEELDHDTDSRAVLPRGLISILRPELLILPGPPAEIVLEPLEGQHPATLRTRLPDTTDQTGIVAVPYPRAWPTLQPGRYVWRIDDGRTSEAAFDLAEEDIAHAVRQRNWRFLTRQVPLKAQNFLRGHHFLNAGLLMQAGKQFGKVAEYFPAEPYPRQQLWLIAEALGVDPTVFLR